MNQILKKKILEIFFLIFRAEIQRADPLCSVTTQVRVFGNRPSRQAGPCFCACCDGWLVSPIHQFKSLRICWEKQTDQTTASHLFTLLTQAAQLIPGGTPAVLGGRIRRFKWIKKIRHIAKNKGLKCPRFKRPGCSNRAMQLISKSRKIIRICQKFVFQMPINMSWIKRLSLFGGNWKSPIFENSIVINDHTH